jgi:RNA polymerase sigma-70 factor (ECF subfamily)
VQGCWSLSSGGQVKETRAETGRVVALDERRLLPRHCEGDGAAFGELVTAYRAPVFGYLVRCGISEDVRDDLFQEIFIKIHNAARSYHPDKPLKPWVFTVVANTVRSHYRKLRVRQLVGQDDKPDRANQDPSSQDVVEAHETAAWMNAVLATLPFSQREVVALSCIEKLDQNEVGAALGMPVATVKTHLHRARATLAKALARRNKRAGREVSP